MHKPANKKFTFFRLSFAVSFLVSSCSHSSFSDVFWLSILSSRQLVGTYNYPQVRASRVKRVITADMHGIGEVSGRRKGDGDREKYVGRKVGLGRHV